MIRMSRIACLSALALVASLAWASPPTRSVPTLTAVSIKTGLAPDPHSSAVGVINLTIEAKSTKGVWSGTLSMSGKTDNCGASAYGKVASVVAGEAGAVRVKTVPCTVRDYTNYVVGDAKSAPYWLGVMQVDFAGNQIKYTALEVDTVTRKETGRTLFVSALLDLVNNSNGQPPGVSIQ